MSIMINNYGIKNIIFFYNIAYNNIYYYTNVLLIFYFIFTISFYKFTTVNVTKIMETFIKKFSFIFFNSSMYYLYYRLS